MFLDKLPSFSFRTASWDGDHNPSLPIHLSNIAFCVAALPKEDLILLQRSISLFESLRSLHPNYLFFVFDFDFSFLPNLSNTQIQEK